METEKILKELLQQQEETDTSVQQLLITCARLEAEIVSLKQELADSLLCQYNSKEKRLPSLLASTSPSKNDFFGGIKRRWPGRAPRILLISADPVCIQLAKHLFSIAHACNFQAVYYEKEALDLFQSQNAIALDMLLLDACNNSAAGVISQLKQGCGHETPFIYILADKEVSSGSISAEALRTAGITGLLVKPLTRQSIEMMLVKYCTFLL